MSIYNIKEGVIAYRVTGSSAANYSVNVGKVVKKTTTNEMVIFNETTGNIESGPELDCWFNSIKGAAEFYLGIFDRMHEKNTKKIRELANGR